MKDSKPIPTDHPHETLIAAYAIGKCSLDVQTKIDEHCFTCDECRTRLSILLRLSSLDDNELERSELERLFPLGKETIAQARHPLGHVSNKSIKSTSHSSKNLADGPTNNQFSSGKYSFSLLNPENRGFRIAALCILVAAISFASYYWYVKANSPVQNSLMAMRRSFQFSRPLEARLSGGLDYKPFARTRGNLDNSDINRDQINYALAELTGVVASNPTPQERHALGRLYLFLGEFDKAEAQMKLALEQLGHDAKLHTDIAALYYERSNYADADPELLLSAAVEHYKLAIEIEPDFAEAWFNRALCYEKLSLFLKAKQDWIQYLKLDSTSKWADEARERLKSLETRANRANNSKEDMTVLLEKAVNSNDDETLRSLISQNISNVIQFSNNKLFEQYLSEALDGNNQRAEFLLARLNIIGHLVAENNKDKFIIDLANLAARASPQMKSRILSVHLKLRQADNEFSRSSHDAAYKSYLSAYLAAKRIRDDLHAEIAASNLVRYSNLRADSTVLISLGNRLVSQAERLGHRYIQAQTHAALANGYLASQQGQLALENGLRASTIAKEIGDKDTAISGLIFASAGYTRSGNYRLGVNKSLELLSILTDYPVNKFREFQVYQLMWEPLFRDGNYDLAVEYQQEALHLAKLLNNQSSIAGTMGRMGLNLWKLKRNDEAASYLQEAITKCNTISDKTLRQLLQGELYTTLGDVSLSLGKTEESLANYELALQAIKASNNKIYLSAIYQGTASAYLANNKIPEAEREMRRSISLLEQGREQFIDASAKSLFLARSQNVYLAMIELQFYFKHDYAAAFDYAEVARNRDILGLLSPVSSGHPTGRPVSRPLKLLEVQKNMANNAQMLSYAMTEKGLIIWYVSPNTFYSTTVNASPDKLKTLISDYILKIRTRQKIEAMTPQASELYRYLIQPIVNQLNTDSSLYIIQDGALSQLPFSTLYSQETKRYLIQDYSIVTDHSTSALIQTNLLAAAKSSNASETFIGISNPRFSYRRFSGLPVLPSSEEEVTRASLLYHQSKLFSRDKASESKAITQIRNYSIVHFASHTLDNKDSKMMSAILLAEEDQTTIKEKQLAGVTFDGMLQASEIYRLKLPLTKLVILSSCRSGVSDYTTGETMGALAKAFFAAKVPSVIASLWDIDDASSAELMYSFHHFHRDQSLGYAASLRQAQCSLLNGNDIDKRHPYYWGAFQLSGSDIGKVNIKN